MYDNEREVGDGMRASGVKRNDVFVTTKIWPTSFHAARAGARGARLPGAAAARAKSICLLLHWPNPNVPLAETIGALCKVKRDGLARHIGVSNFTVAMIEQALAVATEPLVCDQVECHPFLDQSKVLAACRSQGMAVVAYSPIARGNFAATTRADAHRRRHKKTAAQICLRYLVQQNIVVIPRTSKLERLTENAAVFDFTLSDGEMAEIAALARPRRPHRRLVLFRPHQVGLAKWNWGAYHQTRSVSTAR